MCWIIVLTKNQTLEKSKFQNAWRNNNDGAGFMYAKDKQLFIEKGFVDFDSFWESYKDIPEDITRIVHFRKISVGDNIADNHHPLVRELCITLQLHLRLFGSRYLQYSLGYFPCALP